MVLDFEKMTRAEAVQVINDLSKKEIKNWLIPTIEKCRESQIFGSERLINNIYRRLLKLDLLATYENVVDFITWHNQQKN